MERKKKAHRSCGVECVTPLGSPACFAGDWSGNALGSTTNVGDVRTDGEERSVSVRSGSILGKCFVTELRPQQKRGGG